MPDHVGRLALHLHSLHRPRRRSRPAPLTPWKRVLGRAFVFLAPRLARCSGSCPCAFVFSSSPRRLCFPQPSSSLRVSEHHRHSFPVHSFLNSEHSWLALVRSRSRLWSDIAMRAVQVAYTSVVGMLCSRYEYAISQPQIISAVELLGCATSRARCAYVYLAPQVATQDSVSCPLSPSFHLALCVASWPTYYISESFTVNPSKYVYFQLRVSHRVRHKPLSVHANAVRPWYETTLLLALSDDPSLGLVYIPRSVFLLSSVHFPHLIVYFPSRFDPASFSFPNV